MFKVGSFDHLSLLSVIALLVNAAASCLHVLNLHQRRLPVLLHMQHKLQNSTERLTSGSRCYGSMEAGCQFS